MSTWAGKCPSCEEWNTFEESEVIDDSKISSSVSSGTRISTKNWKDEVYSDQKDRTKTNIKSLDEVLGGGFVKGSVNLLAGQPGIGKSTISMQLSIAVAKTKKVLYVSGEESVSQVATRAMRLGAKPGNLQIVSSNVTNDIAKEVASGEYDLVVVDSIQTIALREISSSPGSISQITNSTHMLMNVSKKSDTIMVLIGHVTKEGNIAGPKLLEHIVDVVLQLEGDRYGGFKILRSAKNRYGSTNEAGIFDMSDSGLSEVDNPSQALLSERQVSDGSIILATLEGTRPLLVEVQALVNQSHFGYPKRASSGFDANRLNLLIAVLEKRTKLNLSDKDVYINIVGGIKLSDPAADLAVAMAIASACKSLPLKKDAVVFGEIGLAGEIRHVQNLEKRVKEAVKLGFKDVIGPKTKEADKISKSIKYHSAKDMRSALNEFLGK